MSKSNEELGRRWVALKCWRWMPGMRWVVSLADGAVAVGRIYEVDSTVMSTPLRSDAFPDVTDPATRGCMLALMRESQGDRFAHVVSSRDGARWSVWSRGYDVVGLDAPCEVTAMLDVIEMNEAVE